MSKVYCPVCRVRKVVSDHHIKPRADGGSNGSRNKVPLCDVCHDIVEDIYDRTGIEYSTALAKMIRFGFKLPTNEGLALRDCIHEPALVLRKSHRELMREWYENNREYYNEYTKAYQGERRRIRGLQYSQYNPVFAEGYMREYMKQWRRKRAERRLKPEAPSQFDVLKARLAGMGEAKVVTVVY